MSVNGKLYQFQNSLLWYVCLRRCSFKCVDLIWLISSTCCFSDFRVTICQVAPRYDRKIKRWNYTIRHYGSCLFRCFSHLWFVTFSFFCCVVFSLVSCRSNTRLQVEACYTIIIVSVLLIIKCDTNERCNGLMVNVIV